MSPVFCGIDVSANSFVALCIDQDGNRLGPARSFDNDLVGAGSLVAFLIDLARQRQASRLEIGLESTSVYGAHLRDFLVTSND
jgi:transposase